MDAEKKFTLGFSVFPGIGPVRFKLLTDYFGSAEAAWRAPKSELLAIHLGEKLTGEFLKFRETFDIDDYFRKLVALRIVVLSQVDPLYPAKLKTISDAPIILYVKGVRGDQPINLTRTVGVVGTRKITTYGKEVTQRIVSDLVEAGCTIISGMAYGVDAVAHQTALDHNGQTVAVLGCGVDIIAPPSNVNLYHQISESGHGAIVSEMPLGLRPSKGLFPSRNRIISALSLGVVVTEGADDSGALITAGNAADQGRDVFAVPGPITSELSRGPAKLIKNGAQLVESAEDILNALGINSSDKLNQKSSGNITRKLTETETKIVSILAGGERHIDEIVRESNLTISVIAATLTVLEIEGIVRDIGEKKYVLGR